MTAEYRYHAIKTVRTLNLIRKLRKQPVENLPPQIIQNWRHMKGKYETNCQKMWNLHKNDVIQLTDSQTKHKHLKIEQNKLLQNLKDTKKLHIAVQHYKPAKNFKPDPIIKSLTSDQFRTWINLINGGHSIGWNTETCPYCGKTDGLAHMLNKCQPTDSYLIGKSINTDLNIKARRDAILKICELEKAHTLAVKKRSEEQSLGIDDAKIMDPKPPNPVIRAGAGTYPYDPGAEDSRHGT